ncbi:PhzF family phenazine biosynthesis protein [Wenzhouxiangella sp. XN79A]|uniref:PhzF family phenazine biosynthesis protein n=1 Tax=Wenzhouxiangella sp. XN79A TaxID=2724193 RepID=UPI00144ADD90|nr:PhzF family phenazine biosynthesis protein [Wenzhouxiangella sp. XN79A]NKI35189.1 PhzF family phenazine biosynthesis protein [Wenzhouxiangella sp. XN79A]
MTTRCTFETWDVFTDRRFAGNPLAVVFEADALPTATMQAIAAEFGYSETVFLCRPGDEGADARVRIFTPTGELPFAGHPTVGAACALARGEGRRGALLLELGAGRFPVRLTGGDIDYAEFENPNPPALTGRAPGAEALERALSLPAGRIDRSDFAPVRAGAGIDFIYARTDGATLAEARVDFAAFDALGLDGACGIYLYAEDRPGPSTFEARMFAPHIGVHEDPATGSAAAGLPAHRLAAGALPDGQHEWTVEQGRTMGRPSRIYVRLSVNAGRCLSVRVGGHAVPFLRGELEL